MMHQEFTVRRAYSWYLLIAFAVLLFITSAYCAHLCWRVDGIIRASHDVGPSISRIADLDTKTQDELGKEQATSQSEVTLMLMGVRIQIVLLVAVLTVLSLLILVLLIQKFHAYDQVREDALNAALESNQRFRLIFESEPQCVKVVDRDGRLVDINTAGLKLLEAERDDVLGQCVYDVIADEDRPRFIAANESVLRGESNGLEFAITGLKGTRRVMLTRQVPLRYGPGGEVHVLAITQDVTEKRHIEAELKQHQDRFAHASRVNMMGELLSSISHELNQPLSAATNYAFVLEKITSDKAVDTAAICEHATCIREQVQRAAEIVRNVRSLLKPNADDNGATDIHEVIEDSIGILSADLSQHGIDLCMELQASTSIVFGNHVQLQQVIINLLQNAVQALDQVDPSRRQVIVRTVSTPTEIEIRVEDSGFGIQSQDAEAVFRTFFTTRTEGMGMGLAISRSISEAHGGTLVVERTTDHGTVLLMVLPLVGECIDECIAAENLHC